MSRPIGSRTRAGPLVVLLGLVTFVACGDADSGDPEQGTNSPSSASSSANAKAPEVARQCLVCHSIDGSEGQGPTWRGLSGRTVTLRDGQTVTADDAYLRQSIRDPRAQVVAGYPPIMQPYDELPDAEVTDLVAYIESLRDPNTEGTP